MTRDEAEAVEAEIDWFERAAHAHYETARKLWKGRLQQLSVAELRTLAKGRYHEPYPEEMRKADLIDYLAEMIATEEDD